MEGRKPGRSGRWQECRLSEPRDMVPVHPGPDSSDGCASDTAKSSKASTYSQPLRTRCRIMEPPPSRVPNSSGFQLVPQAGLSQDEWMDAAIGPLRARVLAEVLR